MKRGIHHFHIVIDDVYLAQTPNINLCNVNCSINYSYSTRNLGIKSSSALPTMLLPTQFDDFTKASQVTQCNEFRNRQWFTLFQPGSFIQLPTNINLY